MTDEQVKVKSLQRWFAAARKCDLNALIKTKKHLASVDEVGVQGWTALMHAAHGASQDCVDWLLENGASPNEPVAKSKSSPLYLAAEAGGAGIIRALVGKGARLEDVKGPWGETALAIAAMRGRAETLKVLIEAGGDIEARNRHGEPPLWVASRWGHVECFKLLAEAGADMDSRFVDGESLETWVKGGCADALRAERARRQAREIDTESGISTGLSVKSVRL